MEWQNFVDKIDDFFKNFCGNVITYVKVFIILFALFFIMIKVLKTK